MGMVELTLDALLAAKGVSRYELSNRTGVQYQIIDNYYKIESSDMIVSCLIESVMH